MICSILENVQILFILNMGYEAHLKKKTSLKLVGIEKSTAISYEDFWQNNTLKTQWMPSNQRKHIPFKQSL